MPGPSVDAQKMALAAAGAGLDKKAIDVEIIDVTGKVDYADYLVLMTGQSDRHVASIADGVDGALSKLGWKFIDRILSSGQDICLLFNPSVNAYRRLDPHFEAPNQIKASAVDRGSMVRIPLGNEKSARVEVRSIAPDANPYMALFVLLKTGIEGANAPSEPDKRTRTRYLPDNIYDAIRNFKASRFSQDLLGAEVHEKFAALKQLSADRCPKALGSMVKISEIQFHHEVTNQYLWSQF